MGNITIRHATIVTVDPHRTIIPDGAITIERDRISMVGNDDAVVKAIKPDVEIDGRGRIAIPGLINSHTHMFQCLVRGLGDDMALIEWINRFMLKIIKVIEPEEAEAGAALSCLEMLRTGVTFILDNHHGKPTEKSVDLVASAIKTSGMRGLVARGITQFTDISGKLGMDPGGFPFTPEEQLKSMKRLLEKWNGAKDSPVKLSPAPGAVFACGDELIKECYTLAEKYRVPCHIHTAESGPANKLFRKETGQGEVTKLNTLGVLGPWTHIVHGIWLDDSEIRLMASKKAHHVHCPVSNMQIASGVAPIPKLLSAGVNVCLGSDGPASNNNQDMFGVMKAAALLQKVSTLDPKVISAYSVLEMATIGGARALAMEQEIGSIEVGKKADIVLVKRDSLTSAPSHRPTSTLVYSSLGSDVDKVFIGGHLLVDGGELMNADSELILERARAASEALFDRAKVRELLSN
jgi:5-methylthioadenosine/S-adenosylhomocysteine deaminase